MESVNHVLIDLCQRSPEVQHVNDPPTVREVSPSLWCTHKKARVKLMDVSQEKEFFSSGSRVTVPAASQAVTCPGVRGFGVG